MIVTVDVRRLSWGLGAMLALTALGGCGSSAPSEHALFEILACRGSLDHPEGETFHVEVSRPGPIADLEALVGQGNVKVLTGRIATGDGGFNAPWSWHLVPSTVEAVDLAIEVCDGCPHYVEGHLDDYLGLGNYCPWGAEVVKRLR